MDTSKHTKLVRKQGTGIKEKTLQMTHDLILGVKFKITYR